MRRAAWQPALRRALAGLIVLAGLQGQALLSVSAADSDPRELLAGANRARQAAGAGPLAEDPLLDAVALERSQELAASRRVGHRAAVGETVFELLQRRGVSFSSAAENVAWSAGPAERAADDALQSFLASPAHRANLLNPRFSAVGVGLVSLDDETYLALVLVE
jgi:uncharacterized protein YkwD